MTDRQWADKIDALYSAVRKAREEAQTLADSSRNNPYTLRAAEALEKAAYMLAEASLLENKWVAQDLGDDDL